MVSNAGVQPGRIVVQLNVRRNAERCLLKRHPADTLHLALQGSPKALNRLVVAGGTGPRHALDKATLFHQFLRLSRCILAPTITMKNRVLWTAGISPHRHSKGILDQCLGLVLPYRPSNNPAGGYVDYATHIQLSPVVFQLCNIGTPQGIGNNYAKLVQKQVFFQVYGLLGPWLPSCGLSSALRTQAVFSQNTGYLCFAYLNPLQLQLFPYANPAIVSSMPFKTVNNRFLQLDFFTFRYFRLTVICAS